AIKVQAERESAQRRRITLSRNPRAVQVVLTCDLVAVVTVDDRSVWPDRDRHLHTVLKDRLLKIVVLVRREPGHHLVTAHAAPSSTISPSSVGCSDSGCGSVCICASSTRASIKSRAPFTSCAGNCAASAHRARNSSVSVVCSTRARNESTSTTAGCSTA